MDSVVIVTDSAVSLSELRRAIPSMYDVDDGSDERIVIESNGRRVYLGADSRVHMDMEPEELSRITDLIPEPRFYVVDFNDIDLCKELLSFVANRRDVLIDNDHGVILSGSEFVRVIRNRPEWDWRCDPVAATADECTPR